MSNNSVAIIEKSPNSNIKKKEVLNLSKEEKLKYFDDLVIVYPQMKEILSSIEDCKNSTKYSSQPECLSLVGPYRCGKTTIIETYTEKFPDILTEEGTIKPILYCSVPCPATSNGLVSALLEGMGDPFYYKRSTIYFKKSRLKDFLRKCNVELIILDEVQHLIDSNRRKLIRETADWFKLLITETNIPVIFVGLEYALQVFEENKQLGSRVLNRYQMKPFGDNDKSFRILLHCFDKSLPLKNLSNLENDEISKYILTATQGRLGYLKVLLKEALKIAIDENYNHITIPILSKSYENKLKHLCGPNPFLP